jgi:hypothetical protein
MFERPVAVIEDAYTIPEFGFLSARFSEWVQILQQADKPLGLGDDTMLADMMSMPAGGRPS